MLFILSSGIEPAWAAGLSTRFGEVTVNNLAIGQRYSMRELAKLPLVIFNDSDSPIELEIDPLLPAESELKKGYEAIPNLAWITLKRDRLRVGPNMYGETDVFITIPNEEKYLGKRYQVFIWSRTVGKSIGLGLKSKLLFTIATEKDARESSGETHSGFDFEVTPDKIVVRNVKIGKIFDVEKETGIVLSVSNNGTVTKRFRVESIRVSDSYADLAEGYRECPFPSFLTLETLPEFELTPGSTSRIRMYLNFPERDTYADQNYMFLVKISQEEVAIYTHIYVLTIE